jgi:hypothetical protein
MTCVIDKNVHLHAPALKFVEDFLRRIRLLEIPCAAARGTGCSWAMPRPATSAPSFIRPLYIIESCRDCGDSCPASDAKGALIAACCSHAYERHCGFFLRSLASIASFDESVGCAIRKTTRPSIGLPIMDDYRNSKRSGSWSTSVRIRNVCFPEGQLGL